MLKQGKPGISWLFRLPKKLDYLLAKSKISKFFANTSRRQQ